MTAISMIAFLAFVNLRMNNELKRGEVFMLNIRKCDERNIAQIAKLSKEVLEDLERNGTSDLFGGVDESEIADAMKFPSTVIMAEDDNNKIIGFLLLQKPSEEEEEEYKKEFPNSYKAGEGIIVNGIGVDPKFRKNGFASRMLKFGKEYAIEHGFTKFIGTIHPNNDASAGALSHIAKMEKGNPFIHKTRDGRDLLMQYFIQKLV